MVLEFNITEQETLAFSEQYYQNSVSHQRVRNLTRWVLPALLFPIAVILTFQFGFAWPVALIFLFVAVVWFVVGPKRFDKRVRGYMKKQIMESSYRNCFGSYRVTIDENQLVSEGPIGRAEYRWSAVDRVVLTDDFLFIFLYGPSGIPIRIADVGNAVATQAYDRLTFLIKAAKEKQKP